MSNTLTSMIPDIYAALDVVSRELVGFIPSVAMDASANRVAVGQNLQVAITPANAAGADFTPQMAPPTAAFQTITPTAVTISKQRFWPFSWEGREIAAVNAGAGHLTLRQQQIYQALRAACNEIETDLAAAAAAGALQAYGTAGTAPFGTAGDYTDASNMQKILDDNGAPQGDRSLVVNTAAAVNLVGKQAQAQMAGNVELQRRGILQDVAGFTIRKSAQIVSHTSGTAASATTDNAGYAVGSATITLASAGTGTILVGDVISHARDTRKYVVKTGDADVSGGGTFVLNSPGIRQLITAATSALTLAASFSANVALSRNALLLVTRLPDMPAGGDQAKDSIIITDPVSGLSFEIREYPGVGMSTYLVFANWGVKVLKNEHIALLLG